MLLYLLGLTQAFVQFVDFLSVKFQNLRILYHFLVGRVRNLLLGTPCLQVGKTRDDKCTGKLLVLAHHQNLLNQFGGGELGFNHVGVDVFATRSLEETLDTTCYLQAVVLVKLTHIARVEPAFLIDDFLSEFRLFIVAHHHVVTSAANLTIVGNLHLGAGQWLTHIPYLASMRVAVADSDNGRCFGKTITFKHGHLDGREEASYLL